MEGFQTNENPVDVLSRAFVARYKYELIASVALVALIGGIVFGMQVIKRPDTVEPTFTDTPVDVVVSIDIGGAVLNPGVYEHKIGSRVKDAIEAAGGFVDQVDTTWVSKVLNQAQVLTDGQKIVIPFMSEAGGVDSDQSLSKDSLINLNSASLSELTSLSGIGPSYAKRIMDNRPYRTVDDLLQVPGIGPATLNAIRDQVSVY